MKTGILTYHFAINYGAALQCYALRKYLTKGGHDVHVLNLVTKEQEKNNSLFHKRTGIRNLILNISLLPFVNVRKRKKQKFDDFSYKYFSLSEKCTSTSELYTMVNKNNYEIIISGSDQVWCPKIEDFTDAFFIPFETTIKKIGYAVSIGGSSEKDLNKYGKFINDFYSIGVREESAINVLSKLTPKKFNKVVDPTLLLTEEDWSQLADSSDVTIKERYMICYFLKKPHFDKSYSLAKKIAKDKKLKIVYINQRYSKYSFLSNTLHDIGPEDFVSLFKNASFVCTDSFHGTLFSIIFKKNFYSFVESEKILDRRKQDILDKLNLLNKCIYLDNPILDNLEIDYDSVSEKLNTLRNESITFLKESIEF